MARGDEMFNRKLMKWNVAIVLLLIFLYGALYVAYDTYLASSQSRAQYVYLFLHIIVVAFSVSISMLLWHVSRMREQRLYALMGAFMLFMSILQIALFILSDKIVFTQVYNYGGMGIFLNTFALICLPVGGVLVSTSHERKATQKYRNGAYTIALVAAILVIIGSYIIFLNEWYLWDAQQTNVWKLVMTTTAIILYLILAMRIMPRFYARLTVQFQYTWCFIVFIVMLLFIQLSHEKMDMLYLYAQILEVVAYMFFSSAIFSLTIESPYNQLAKSREKVRRIAYFHDITGLPNRIYFRSLINKSVMMNDCDYASIIVLEVQRIASVRSVLGIDSTHNILRCVTDRLQGVLPEHSILGMLKEDKIGIMLPCDDDVNHEAIYKQLASVIEEPMEVHHYVLHLNITMGIAQYPEHGQDAETLIKHANLALMESKKEERAFVVYTDMLEFDGRHELQLEHDLQQALERRELFVAYQPQLDVSTQKIFSAEALLRWEHPQEGIISPETFIPIAERTGIMLKIGEWVLQQACEDAQQWATYMERPIKIAVNISVSQLLQSNIVDVVKHALDASALNPNYLELEITESMMVDSKTIIPILQQLKLLGVSIAVDDFGTGYSSLSYLSDLPVDYLKVDRSFVEKLGTSKKDDDLMRAILKMGQTLHLQTIVEGVETIEQFQQLRQLPCDYIQGYFVSKPICFDQLIHISQFDYRNYV